MTEEHRKQEVLQLRAAAEVIHGIIDQRRQAAAEKHAGAHPEDRTAFYCLACHIFDDWLSGVVTSMEEWLATH